MSKILMLVTSARFKGESQNSKCEFFLSITIPEADNSYNEVRQNCCSL